MICYNTTQTCENITLHQKKKKNRGQNTLHSSVLKSKLAIEFQRTGATITIPNEGLAMHKPTVAENSPLNFS